MPSIENEDGIIPDEDFKFSIEFKDVHFSYPSRPQDKVIFHFSTTIHSKCYIVAYFLSFLLGYF